jgi:hypothetical protein
MRGSFRTIALAASVAFVLAAPAAAFAESTPEQKAAATVLFREAKGMMEQGDVAAACRRFEESHRLDPLPGTLLNMAVCHEREGRTATAWVEFRDAAALARRDGRDDRVTLAEEHMKGLEPRLSTVRITVGPRADLPSLTVTLDGTDLARPAWDTALPVDPGAHVVGASAPSAKPFSARVEVVREGESQTVTIDALEPAPPLVVPEVVPPAPALLPVVPPLKEEGGLSTRRVSALALGGAAIVGLGVGTYFGLDAISKHAASNGGCPANQCSAQAVVENDQSKTSADRSTVAFAVALPALAVATYLWFSGGHSKGASSALRVAPMVGRDGGGLSVAHTF